MSSKSSHGAVPALKPAPEIAGRPCVPGAWKAHVLFTDGTWHTVRVRGWLRHPRYGWLIEIGWPGCNGCYLYDPRHVHAA